MIDYSTAQAPIPRQMVPTMGEWQRLRHEGRPLRAGPLAYGLSLLRSLLGAVSLSRGEG
jgi:hypothetical protein